MIKTQCLCFLLLLQFSFLFSQNKSYNYLGINNEPLSKIDYEHKLKSEFIGETIFIVEEEAYKKLFFLEFFGKLDADTKSQLNKLMYARHQVDTTAIWLIRYRDTLPNITTLPESSKIVFYPKYDTRKSKRAANSLNKVSKKGSLNINPDDKSWFEEATKLTKHEVFCSYEDLYNQTKTTQNRYKNNSRVVPINMFLYNKGFPLEDNSVVWIEDPYSIFKNTFFEANIPYHHIKIHPDGEFYINIESQNFVWIDYLLDLDHYKESKKLFLENLKEFFPDLRNE